MNFTLTMEQKLLRDAVASFLASRYDFDKSRQVAATGPGWHPELWRAFSGELGILGATLPESAGGVNGGPIEMMVVTEELGRALVIEPYVETVVVGGGLLQRAGGARADELLAGIVEGNVRTALAASEPASGYALHDVSTIARREAGTWVLSGAKVVVSGAPQATHLLVTARTSGGRRDTAGVSLFLVPFDADSPPVGVHVERFRTVDDRRAADIVFDEVRLQEDALLGEEGAAWPAIAQTLDEATAAICSEAVGCMRKVLDDTVEYAKQRQQFGRPIGSFQVLQHRMVDMYMELEQSISAVHLAVLTLLGDPDERARAVSAAKVTVGRAARFIGQNAVQLHGAMGMTQEMAVGHYFKRLTVIEYEFGSVDHHIARYAALTRAAS